MPMTVERAKAEIEHVLAQLEGTGVIVTDIGFGQYDTQSGNDPTPVRYRGVVIHLQPPSPRYAPFSSLREATP